MIVPLAGCQKTNATSNSRFAALAAFCQHDPMTESRPARRDDAESAPVPTTERARRIPLQERSAETCRRIEEAATRLLADGASIEAITTQQIAKQAGVSVGALYRFFPDKQAIVDAVAMRRLAEFEEAMAVDLLGRPPFATGADLIEHIIDLFVAFLGAHPEFATVLYGPGHISDAIRHRHFGHDSNTAQLARRYTAEVLRMTDTPVLALRWEILGEIAGPLIGFATGQPDPERRAAALREVKRLLANCLVAAEPARSSPPG